MFGFTFLSVFQRSFLGTDTVFINWGMWVSKDFIKRDDLIKTPCDMLLEYGVNTLSFVEQFVGILRYTVAMLSEHVVVKVVVLVM